MTKINLKKGEFGEDAPEQNITVFPEWQESEVLAEKWISKHAFEDPEGQIYLPRAMRKQYEGMKRFCDIVPDATPVVLAPPNLVDEMFYSVANIMPIGKHVETKLASPGSTSGTPSTPDSNGPTRRASGLATQSQSKGTIRGGTLAKEGGLDENSGINPTGSFYGLNRRPSFIEPIPDNEPPCPVSKFTHANKHLLGSEFIISLITSVHILYDQCRNLKFLGAPGDPDCSMPWENIFPKQKDGTPLYNASGKYIVKLFWLGSWRKVTIDDRVPVDSAGKPLLLVSANSNELWPILISKALLKIACASYKEDTDCYEFGDFDIFTCLRGWIPEKIPLTLASINQTSHVMRDLILQKQKEQSNTTRQQTFSNGAGSRPATVTNVQAPGTPLRIPSLFPLVVAFKRPTDYAQQDAQNWGINYHTFPIPYRVIDRQKSPTSNSKGYIIRSYVASGCKKGGLKTEEFEFYDQWVSAEELGTMFGSIVAYHIPSSYRTIKTISSVADTPKLSETIRIPSILHTGDHELEHDHGALISISTYGRILCQSQISGTDVYIEEYDWKNPNNPLAPRIRLTSNGFASTFLKLKPATAYRISVLGSTPYHLTVYSKEEIGMEEESKYLVDKKGLKMREFEELSPAQQAGAWSILFKHVVMIQEPTLIATNFYSSDTLLTTSTIRAINNDTGEELAQNAYTLAPQIFQPTKSGYTILGESRAIAARPPTKWKLRIFSDILSNSLIDKELWLCKMNINDSGESYVPNKHNILFRFAIRSKDGPLNNLAIQTTFSLPNVWIRLQFFDNDMEVYTSVGKGVACIYSAILYQAEEPKKDDKKVQAQAVQSTTSTTPKHKYVLQASIEPSELEKLTNATERPNSRGGKNLSSAGKKKPKSAGTGTQQYPNNQQGAAAPVNADLDFTWKLRLVSSDGTNVVVSKDTEKEDRYKAIKESWEAAVPGRMNRARENRDNFLKLTEVASYKPLYIHQKSVPLRPWTVTKTACPKVLVMADKSVPIPHPAAEPKSTNTKHNNSRPPSAYPYDDTAFSLTCRYVDELEVFRVLNAKDSEELAKARTQSIQSFQEAQAEDLKKRIGNREQRGSDKKKLIEIVEAKMRELESEQQWDLEKREAYRQKVLLEKEEEAQARARAALEASKLAELIGEGGDEQGDRKKKAKK